MISQELEHLLQYDPPKKEHEKVIRDLLEALNRQTDHYVLKGGTSLMECYKLNRMSEDIDLDSADKNTIKTFIEQYCKTHNYRYRIAKDTDTVKRFMIHYDDQYGFKPLKVEISYRRGRIDPSLTNKINNIMVYNIDALCIQKTSAYSQRDKLRDLYDVSFIVNNYYSQLSPVTIEGVRSAVAAKGIEQYDYVIQTQYDELINIDKLAEQFLNMYDKLGLIENRENEHGSISEQQQNDDAQAKYLISNVLNGMPELALKCYDAQAHIVSFSKKEPYLEGEFTITFNLAKHCVQAYLADKRIPVQTLKDNYDKAYNIMQKAIDIASHGLVNHEKRLQHNEDLER